MNREFHLSYCKVCKYKSFDPKKGIVCGYTGEYANFETTCPEFEKEDSQVYYQNKIKTNQNTWAENKVVFISILVFAFSLLRTGCSLYSNKQRDSRVEEDKQKMEELYPELFSEAPEYKEKREAEARKFHKHLLKSMYPSLELQGIGKEDTIRIDDKLKIFPSKGEFRVLNTMPDIELYSIVNLRREKYGVLKFEDSENIGLGQLKSYIKHIYGEGATLNFINEPSKGYWNYTILRGENVIPCLGRFFNVKGQVYFVFYEARGGNKVGLLPKLEIFYQSILN